MEAYVGGGFAMMSASLHWGRMGPRLGLVIAMALHVACGTFTRPNDDVGHYRFGGEPADPASNPRHRILDEADSSRG